MLEEYYRSLQQGLEITWLDHSKLGKMQKVFKNYWAFSSFFDDKTKQNNRVCFVSIMNQILFI